MMDIPGYKIVRELGRGGMATVYLAEQEKFERQVALKVMASSLNTDPSFKERFIREAKLVARLSHPNIVAVYDVGEHGGHVYMAMEYHTGGDLKARIRSGMTPAEAVKVTAETARALEFAHSKGVIHRDIKPDNILFRNDGSAVLTDFGIAKQGDAQTQFTQMGMVAGTPKYMSPEQARGLPLDAESDLYSLGIVFYEMLTGDVPFKAEDSIALAIKHLKDPAPPLSPPLKRFQPFLDRMLAKEPARRFHRGGEVATMLEGMAAGGSLKSMARAAPSTNDSSTQLRTAVSAAELESGGAGGRRALYALVGIAALAGAGAGWYFTLGPGGQPVPVPQPEPAPVVKVEPPPPPAPVPVVEESTPEPVVEAAPEKPKEPGIDVAGLLKKAAEALADDRLIAPEGNNAWGYYRQVLIAEPNNKKARDGLKRIADRLIELIDESLAGNNVKQARQFLADGEKVAPSYPPLGDAATRIANYEAAQAAPKATPPPTVVEETVPTTDPTAVRNRLRASGLASKGATAAKQSDFAGARSYFEQALELDPANRVAQDGIAQLDKLGK